MRANWISENTVTTGVGAVTLSGVTSADRRRFNAIYITGMTVKYELRNGNNRESGFGVYDATADTLTRDYIVETLVAGVSNAINPTPITLVGTSTISVSPDASNKPPLPGYMLDPVNYRNYPDNFNVALISDGVNAANRCIYTPMYLAQQTRITRLTMRVVIADAAAPTTKIAIYAMAPNASMGAKLIELDLPVGVAGVVDTALISPTLVLPSGYYYTAVASSSATLSMRRLNVDAVLHTPLGYNSAVGRAYLLYEVLAGGWTTLPTVPNPITGQNNGSLVMWP